MQQTRPPYAGPSFPYGVFYLAAALVFIDQASEVFINLIPPRWSEAEWRFGAFGVVLGRVTSLMLVITLAVIAAWGRNDRRVLRLLGGLHIVLTVAGLAGLAFFGLDFLEFRRQVRGSLVGPVNYAAARAAGVSLLLAVYGLVAGVGLIRATAARRGREDAPVLVTGGGGRHG